MSTTVSTKVIFPFNSYLVDTLLIVKTLGDLRTAVKQNYISVDKSAESHVIFGSSNLPISSLATENIDTGKFGTVIVADTSVGEESDVKDVKDVNDHPFIKGVTVGRILGAAEGKKKRRLIRLLFTMSALAALAKVDAGALGDKEVDALIELIINVHAIGEWSGTSVPPPTNEELVRKINAVESAEVRGILANLLRYSMVDDLSEKETSDKDLGLGSGGIDPAVDMFSKIQGSKIGMIAKEVAEEVDFSSFDPSKPQEWLDIANLADPKTMLGGIVSKLGSKITEKMKNGELRQEDILSDAMGLISTMGISGQGGGADVVGGLDILRKLSAGLGGMGGNSIQPTKP